MSWYCVAFGCFLCDREHRALTLCPAIVVSRELVSWSGVVDFVGLFSFWSFSFVLFLFVWGILLQRGTRSFDFESCVRCGS